MNPSLFLLLLLTITLGAGIRQYRVRRSLARELRRLASRWQMNYSQGDPLQLTQRIAVVFPVNGAAHVTITDLIYGLEQDNYRYYLATEFTVGLTRSKKRVRRVVTFTEPRSGTPRTFSPMRVAPAELSIVEQFEHLRPDVAAKQLGLKSHGLSAHVSPKRSTAGSPWDEKMNGKFRKPIREINLGSIRV